MTPLALINPDFEKILAPSLRDYGFRTAAIPPSKQLHPALRGHVDLSCLPVDGALVVRPDFPDDFIHEFLPHIEVVKGKTHLSDTYPDDIAYNAAVAGSFFFHRTDRTDPAAKELLIQKKDIPIHIKQGYSRCSILPLPDGSVITSDKGAAKAALSNGMAVCRIEPGHIALPGFKYGFIGGCGGSYQNRVFLTGSLAKHPDRGKIHDFAREQNVSIVELTKKEIFDAGSLFFI